MTTHFHTVTIKIGSYEDASRPELDKDKSFYAIYSPETFTLQPRDNILLDLKITVDAPEKVEAWINLWSCLKERGMKIEGRYKLKDNTIQLDILNKIFCKTTTIKKDQEIAYMFLLGQKFNKKIITEYTTIT